MFQTLYGILGIVGRWANWREFFDLSRQGMFRSLFALILCFPALWLILTGIETERARMSGQDAPDISIPAFLVITTLWIGSFHLSSFLIASLMGKSGKLALWWTVRNWALVWICVVLGLIFALTMVGLPFIIANGALFAAYLGLLPIDIRIAQRAAGFSLGSAILVACVVVSTSMVVLLTSLLHVLQASG